MAGYVGTEYGNLYNHIQGCFGVDLRRVIGDTKARVSTTNTQYIATLLSFTNMKEYAMHYWVEIIIKKFWPVSWVEDEYIQSVIKHPSSANVSTKTVKNILFVLE